MVAAGLLAVGAGVAVGVGVSGTARHSSFSQVHVRSSIERMVRRRGRSGARSGEGRIDSHLTRLCSLALTGQL